MDIDGLLRTWVARDRDGGPRKARDRETLEFFEGRVAVPLPEIDRFERTAVANLMAQGITAQAQRIASTSPMPWFPAETQSRAADRRARDKKKALRGMWDENRLHLQRQQRARWLIAYASSPVIVRPRWNPKTSEWRMAWEPRSSLSAYPASTGQHLDMCPNDTIFATTHKASSIEARYPAYAPQLRGLRGYNSQIPSDADVTLIEFYGPDEIILACVGSKNDASNTQIDASWFDRKWAIQLERVENRIGRSMVIIPNGISLEQPLSRYEGMKGLYQQQARLMALEYRYVANSVDPPIWFVEGEQGGGTIVKVANGPSGEPGHVRGGSLQALNPPPGVATASTIDRLERAQRLEGGISPDIGGESGSNIRTGVRGQDILSAVMDFPIQEAQMLLGESNRLEDMLAIDGAKAWFGDLKRTWGGFAFTPNTTFAGDNFHDVKYGAPGTDANGLVIRMGQLQGTGLISKRTARENIPDIDDPEFEDDQVTAEQITQGILAEFMQPGSFGLPDKARVAQLVGDDKKDLADAILQVQLEAQQRQASTVNPVAPGAPEAQPGIAPAGAGAEAGTVGPPPDLAGLTALSGALRLGQRAAPQEQAAEATASVA